MIMVKKYTGQNVYDAFQQRMHFIFKEFDNIFVSFSGGKDSGALLNLVLDFQEKYYPDKKIGVFHQDFEAQYTVTTEYVEKTFARLENKAELYWVCLPMATRTALSSYEMFWYPWDDVKKDAWVLCHNILMLLTWKITQLPLTVIKCTRKTLLNSLAGGTEFRITIKKLYACLVQGQKNLYNVTVVYCIRNMDIKGSAG